MLLLLVHDLLVLVSCVPFLRVPFRPVHGLSVRPLRALRPLVLLLFVCRLRRPHRSHPQKGHRGSH